MTTTKFQAIAEAKPVTSVFDDLIYDAEKAIYIADENAEHFENEARSMHDKALHWEEVAMEWRETLADIKYAKKLWTGEKP